MKGCYIEDDKALTTLTTTTTTDTTATTTMTPTTATTTNTTATTTTTMTPTMTMTTDTTMMTTTTPKAVQFHVVQDRVDCQPSSKWLGTKDTSKECAHACRNSNPRALRFVWAQHNDKNCKCVGDDCKTNSWSPGTLYQYGNPPDQLTTYCVGDVYGPHRFRVSLGSNCGTNGWRHRFTFHAFRTQRPGTTSYCVGYADWPHRFRVSQGSSCGNAGWTHDFIFYAYSTQQQGSTPYCVSDAYGPHRYRVSEGSNCGNSGWTYRLRFYADPQVAPTPTTEPTSSSSTFDPTRWPTRTPTTLSPTSAPTTPSPTSSPTSDTRCAQLRAKLEAAPPPPHTMFAKQKADYDANMVKACEEGTIFDPCTGIAERFAAMNGGNMSALPNGVDMSAVLNGGNMSALPNGIDMSALFNATSALLNGGNMSALPDGGNMSALPNGVDMFALPNGVDMSALPGPVLMPAEEAEADCRKNNPFKAWGANWVDKFLSESNPDLKQFPRQPPVSIVRSR